MTNPITLGLVFSLIGLCQIAGTFFIFITGGPKKNHLSWIIILSFVQAGILIFGYLKGNIWLMGLASGSYLFLDTINKSCNRYIWLNTAPKKTHGRVFAFYSNCMQITAVIAFILIGPIADKFLRPDFSKAGLLSQTIGKLTGIGPAYGLMFGITIFGFIFLASVFYINKKLFSIKKHRDKLSIQNSS